MLSIKKIRHSLVQLNLALLASSVTRQCGRPSSTFSSNSSETKRLKRLKRSRRNVKSVKNSRMRRDSQERPRKQRLVNLPKLLSLRRRRRRDLTSSQPRIRSMNSCVRCTIRREI
jgi:hypothetical protein